MCKRLHARARTRGRHYCAMPYDDIAALKLDGAIEVAKALDARFMTQTLDICLVLHFDKLLMPYTANTLRVAFCTHGSATDGAPPALASTATVFDSLWYKTASAKLLGIHLVHASEAPALEAHHCIVHINAESGDVRVGEEEFYLGSTKFIDKFPVEWPRFALVRALLPQGAALIARELEYRSSVSPKRFTVFLHLHRSVLDDACRKLFVALATLGSVVVKPREEGFPALTRQLAYAMVDFDKASISHIYVRAAGDKVVELPDNILHVYPDDGAARDVPS